MDKKKNRKTKGMTIIAALSLSALLFCSFIAIFPVVNRCFYSKGAREEKGARRLSFPFPTSLVFLPVRSHLFLVGRFRRKD